MAVQSDVINLDNAKAAVHSIVTRLETRFTEFNISEIIKGGSLGHGTAVPGKYDIDLVIYSRDIRPEDVERQKGFGKWTNLLKAFIEREFDVRSFTPGYNHRSVQFTFEYRGVSLDVDLLVSPYWDTPHDFYQYLRSIQSKESRDRFSACASKWQVEFFRNKDSKVKEYIKRAKAWRNKVWSAKPGKPPSSYLISLLVVKAYENSGYLIGPQEVTRALIALVKHSPVNVYWADGIYNLSNYSDLQPSAYQYRIIDPANPANNVWDSLDNPGDLIGEIVSIDLK